MAPPPPPPKNQQNKAAGLNSLTPAYRPTPLPSTSQQPPLYYPTIFRYKCRGGFFATSDEPYSNGVCRGIQTQLQHVRDLHKSTEDESVRMFLQDYVPPRQDDASQASSQHNEILSIPAMIYEDPKQKEMTKQTNALLLKNNVPKEEEEEWHDWACYGTTEVRLLVLRNAKTNEEKTTAVAPNCRLGLSVRDVGNEQGGDTVATVRMGPVEVLLRNQYELHEEKPSKHLQQQQKKQLENTLKGIEDSESLGKEEKQRTQIAHRHKKSSDEESNMPANPSNRSISTTTFINGGQKVFESSKKVVASMQTNANILYEAVREDFPQRTWGASQRVVGQFGKTIERTSTLMNQLYDIWNEDDEED